MKRVRFLARWVLSALAVLGTVAWAGAARAEGGKVQVGFDLDWAAADDAGESGVGGALRLGYELDLIILTLIPEIGGTYHSFADLDTKVYRGIAGARLRFLKVVEPGVYAHLGVGHLTVDRTLGPSWTAATSDFGVSLDFTLLPIFEFGVHGGYNVQFEGDEETDGFDWWTAGLNAALVFD